MGESGGKMTFDQDTLGVVVVAATSISAIVMILLWRVSERTPGTGMWAVAAFVGMIGFIGYPLRGRIDIGGMNFVNNAAALTSTLLILEGIMRFREFGRQDRRYPLLAVLILLFIVLSFVNRNDALRRSLIHDSFFVVMYMTIAFILVYRSRHLLLWTHLVAAVPALLLAMATGYRWSLAIRGILGVDTTGTAVVGIVFLTSLIWVLGWTYGLSMAVNYQTHRRLDHARIEAEHSSVLKSQFLAHTSHELRNPLNAVIGMSHVLTNMDTDDDQREYASIIHRSATSLLGIINDILDLSRIEAGQMEIEERSFDLPDEITQTIALFQFQAEQKGLDLEVHIDEGVPHRILGDPGRLRQVLINLVGNAIKFTDEGSVTVRVRPETPVTGTPSIVFEIRDTGPGIPKDKTEELFQSFVQLDGTRSRRHGGTGLGLTISRHLVQLMDGTVGVDSTEGRGSTFVVAIPLRIPGEHDYPLPTDTSDTTALPPSDDRPVRILVVDDQEINHVLMCKLLELSGWSATSARTGREAIELVRTCPFDLILMDIEMPDMDGLQTTAEIRRNETLSNRRTPIVAVTAHAMKGDKERLLALEVDDYLSKPIDNKEMQRVVQRLVFNRDANRADGIYDTVAANGDQTGEYV